MTMERRSAPMMILSLARSKSSMSTRRLLLRAANSAASFTRLARSAPDIPGRVLEPVHLDQELVQRLLALVVASAQARAALAADRVDFVDEDDARRMLFRLLEHVAHGGRPHARQ